MIELRWVLLDPGSREFYNGYPNNAVFVGDAPAVLQYRERTQIIEHRDGTQTFAETEWQDVEISDE